VPPTKRPRAHHRVNPYLGVRRQNETKIFSDHDETSPSIAAVTGYWCDSSGYRPWEVESLHLEVGVESMLNLLQQVVGLDQAVEHVGLVSDHQAVGVLDRLHHDGAPVAVHDRELATFFRHLSHDVLRTEDRLQVQPRRLALNRNIPSPSSPSALQSSSSSAEPLL